MSAATPAVVTRAKQTDLVWAIARIGSVLVIALLSLASLDALCIVFRAPAAPWALVAYWVYSCVLSALTGLIIALGLGALSYLGRGLGERIRSKRVRRQLAAHSYGVLAAMAVYTVLRPWDFYSDRYRSALIVPCAAWLGVVCLRLSRDVLPVRVYVACTSIAALALFAVDALVLHGLYRTFHNVAAFAALICASHAVGAQKPELGHARPFYALGLLLVAVPVLLCWQDNRAAREIGVQHGQVLPRLVALIAPLLDRDRDGFAPMFAEDCDDENPAVHPGACEVANNRRDDNCNGHVDIALPARTTERIAATPRAPRPDVYLIVLDALRADFARQERKRAMPQLDRFARGALDFSSAYTAYPSTHRSMMALSTSRPHRYRSATIPPLPAWLHQAGYDAQAWVRTRRLREEAGAPPIIGADRETSDPFEVRGDDKTAWTAAIIGEAIAELGATAPRAPRFRWLHLLDTHSPWLRGGDNASTRDRYRAELAFADSQLGRLFAALARDPAGSRAVVIVLADHGEELGEHGDVFHGAALWESSIRVPLLLRLPGVAPRSVTGVASLIDVVPTLASYLGLPPHAHWLGHNWLSSAPPPAARVVSEVEPIDNAGGVGIPARVAAVGSRLKLIVNVNEQLTDVYDLVRDPDELTNLSGQHDIEARRVLERALAIWEDGAACVASPR